MDHPDNARLWSFYLADMTIRKLSRHTVLNYQQTLKSLDSFLGKAFSDATKLDLMGYVADQQSKVASATVHLRFIGLRVFYNWMVREELISSSPMRTIPEPAVEDTEPAVSTDADLRTLLANCSSKSFLDRRDNALIRIMLEPGGARRAEILGVKVEDVDLDNGLMRVMGKGGKPRFIPFGAKTAQALMRYLVVRSKHKYASEDELWLGRFGALTIHSLRMILRKRCKAAGIANIYPHQLRHTAADRAMAAGISDLDMQTLFGWTSPAMLAVYARSNRTARAVESARKLNLGDRL